MLRSTGNDSIVMSNNAMNRQKLWNYIYQDELHYPDWSWSTVATETTIDRLSGKLSTTYPADAPESEVHKHDAVGLSAILKASQLDHCV